MSRIGIDARGFSLIEVMVATAVLSLGAAMLCQVFFINLDAFEYCQNFFAVSPLIEEKLWEAQDEIAHYDLLINTPTSGVFTVGPRSFEWSLSDETTGEAPDMTGHRIEIDLTLPVGKRVSTISRSAFALYEKKQQ